MITRRDIIKLLAGASGFMLIPSHYPEVQGPIQKLPVVPVNKPVNPAYRWRLFAIDGLSVYEFERRYGPADLNGPVGFTERDLEFLRNVESDKVEFQVRWNIARAYLARKPISIPGDYLRAERMDVFMRGLRRMIES